MLRVDWHKWPEEKPPLYKHCFITIETVGRKKKRFVSVDFLVYFLGFYWARHRDLKIIAWYMPDPNEKFHEMPEPYQPEIKHVN